MSDDAESGARQFIEGEEWTIAVWVRRDRYENGGDLPKDSEILFALHADGSEREAIGYIAPVENQWLAVDWFGEKTEHYEHAELFLEKQEAIDHLLECYWGYDISPEELDLAKVRKRCR